MPMRCRQDLIDHFHQGHAARFLMFWGHKSARTEVTKACFSQWFPASFEVDGLRYPTAEHFMMAGKARLFGDLDCASRILLADSPGAVKQLGREVSGFDEAHWQAHRFDIVVQGNLAKFGQNAALGDFLCGTGHQVLVEASPVDRIWGIGLAADSPDAAHPARWQGENLLGFALMAVRQRLQEARP